jgi:hypothetical protein
MCGCTLALILSSSVFAQTNPITTGSITVTLQPFATIPAAEGTPQAMSDDGNGHLLIATRNGNIDEFNTNGTSAGQLLNM